MAMQEMVSCVGTEDVFFDSVDHLSEEGSAVCELLGSEFWRDELRSVVERRGDFLREMGFVDEAGFLEVELGRVGEMSDQAMSSTCCVESSSSEVFDARECSGDANLVVDDEWENDDSVRESVDFVEDDDAEPSPFCGHREERNVVESVNKKLGHWWKELIGRCKSEAGNGKSKKSGIRTKVKVNKKRFKEFSAVFELQGFQAHKGIIWAMKFSPDGQFLASGGQDGVVRVWRVKSIDSSLERFQDERTREKKVKVPVVVPDRMFHIEEQPVQEFHGHVGDVLDLAWSNSNRLLSASTDKTVRMWQVGNDKCLNVFHHTDYVTCVQFNPMNDLYFITGSLDEKVRIWGVSKGRVLNWADVGDAVTAVCYQPDGEGFVVGSLGGICRFYEAKAKSVELIAHVVIESSRKSSTNRITGIQFRPEDFQTVMVMSEDSKLRIFDKLDIVYKYRGLPNSGSQMSGSFTSNGAHIISIGEDSNVYIWSHENSCLLSPTHKKSIRSCERFKVEGVCVAVPWSSTQTLPKDWNAEHEASFTARDPTTFAFSNWFSSRSSATWPEEVLPIFSPPRDPEQGVHPAVLPPAWGLVVVTASWDGRIRTFHNCGLPVSV